MEVPLTNVPAERLPFAQRVARRRLLVRDGLKFLALTVVVVVLGSVTTLLFRSFEARREGLADDWAKRGRDALDQGHPADAVGALRTSLAYRPDERENQLALAQALAASGHTSEAENYFLNLWQARPGDGPINLQLARLERSRGDAAAAINYYRAAVFGTWGGDALTRRRDTRLELAAYLVQRGELEAARVELLMSAGNNPDAATQLAIGDALLSAEDPKDALVAYRNAARTPAVAHTADAKAGELCYRMGDYDCSADLLALALRNEHWTAEQATRLASMRRDAGRLQELAVSQAPSSARVARLRDDGRIAQERLKLCMQQQPAATAAGTGLQPLLARWKTLDSSRGRNALLHDDDLQTQYASFIQQTEDAVTHACGAPSGDDALLVYLYEHPATAFGAQ